MSGVLMFYQEQNNFPREYTPFTPLYQGSIVLFCSYLCYSLLCAQSFFSSLQPTIHTKKTQHASALGVTGYSKT